MNTIKISKIMFNLFFVFALTANCFSQKIIQLYVDQPEAINANAGKDTFIYVGDTVQIGSSPTTTGGTEPYNYLWSPSLGLSSTSVANPLAFPTITTTYSLTVTDINGCTSNSSIKIKVSSTGLENYADLVNVKIFPNPNNGQFKILFEGFVREKLTMEIIDNLGQVIHSEYLVSEHITNIDVSQYSEGIYMIRLKNDKLNILKRLIIY